MPSHSYGWVVDGPDQRDYHYSAPLQELGVLPPSVDLRVHCPAIYDQGQLGSCTANAIAAAIEVDQIKQSLPESTPSRLFIYYNERVVEDTVSSDSGAQIRDGIKSVNKLGACPETLWPYDINRFSVMPSSECYKAAQKQKSVQYSRVPRLLSQMKGCLASGNVFTFGFTVYESFETDQVATSGIVPMPRLYEQVLGGHAVVAVGYFEAKQWFVCRNSWSSQWGDMGYFYMPYAYLLDPGLSSDFWVIKSIT